MTYLVFASVAVALSTLAARWVPSDDAVPAAVASAVRLWAIVGAVVGAHLFEWPADHFGWAPPVDGHALFGARTVLGGMLGGWLAVEACKARLGYRLPTGDRFALPLAVALAVGRLGCVFTGCCPGVRLAPGDPWAAVSSWLGREPRFPATLVEAWFHAFAAVALLLAMAAGVGRHARLAGYLATYAVVRFALETRRDVPRPFAGLSWYQVLCVALFALAGLTFVRRVWFAAPVAAAGRTTRGP